MSGEFDEGVDAAERGVERTSNPHETDTLAYTDWNDGWDFHTNGGV